MRAGACEFQPLLPPFFLIGGGRQDKAAFRSRLWSRAAGFPGALSEGGIALLSDMACDVGQ